MTYPAAEPRPKLTHIGQGSFEVSGDPATVMTTILGSCVSVMLHDPKARIGGMNHFLLPEQPEGRDAGSSMIFGVHSMELLINAMMKQGANRKRFEAKLFGGAKIVAGLSKIGERNAEFAHEFLRSENIPCLAESLGGTHARRIRFWPSTARVRQMKVVDPSIALSEQKQTRPKIKPQDDSVELFT